MGLLDAVKGAGRLLSRIGKDGGADLMEKALYVAPNNTPAPQQAIPNQPAIPTERQERPLYDVGFGPIFLDSNGSIGKAMSGVPAVTDQTLLTLSRTDPVTWSIIDVFKTRITEMGWVVVPDVEKEKSELLLWEKEAMLAASRFSSGTKPSYKANFLAPQISGPLRSKLLALKADDMDVRKKIRWLIDWADLEVRKDLIPRAHQAEQTLKGCNTDTVDPFKTLNELTIDDLCVFDAGSIGMLYNRIGELINLYHIPGEEVKIYKNADFSTPVPPYRAFAWEVAGKIAAEFTTQDLLYIVRNPQKNGYGYSPLRAAAYIIQMSLYADAYNMDSFKSNMPPGIVELGNITPEQRQRFRVYWNNEVRGKDGGEHKLFFSNFKLTKDSFIPLVGNKQTDMQYMEWLEWSLLIKCMCYGVSPQEIGFTKFFKYETSTNQIAMTNRGVEDAAKFVEGAYTEGVIKGAMGLKGLKFQFKRSSTMINEQAVKTAQIRVASGLATPNEIRQEWGQRDLPEGGDIAFLSFRTGAQPVAEIGAELPGAGEDPEDPAGGEEPLPDDLDAAIEAMQAAAGKGKKPAPGAAPEAQPGQAQVAKAYKAITDHLAKKLGIDYKAPAGGGQGGRIKGARARRNQQLRKFRGDIRTKAVELARKHGDKVKRMLGDK